MKVLLMALILISTSVIADDAKKSEMFEKVKTDMISNIDQKISAHQTAKSCIQAASKQEELKECHKTMREAMKKLHGERKDKKMHYREARKERKKEKAEKKKDQ